MGVERNANGAWEGCKYSKVVSGAEKHELDGMQWENVFKALRICVKGVLWHVGCCKSVQDGTKGSSVCRV